MNVEPVDFSEVDGDIPFPWRAPILEWLDKRIEQADNVQKSYLGFTMRAIINSGVDQTDINDLCHDMLVRQRGLIPAGAYSLHSRFSNAISIIRCFEREQKKGFK